MKSFQKAVIDQIEVIANTYELSVIQESEWGNIGSLHIMDGWDRVVVVRYEFQSHGSKLLINGAKHGPPGPDNYFVTPADTARINAFFSRMRALIRERVVS